MEKFIEFSQGRIGVSMDAGSTPAASIIFSNNFNTYTLKTLPQFYPNIGRGYLCPAEGETRTRLHPRPVRVCGGLNNF